MNKCEKCGNIEGPPVFLLGGTCVSICSACAREWNDMVREEHIEFDAKMRERANRWLAKKRETEEPKSQ